MGEKSISIPSLSCYILLTTLHIISFSQLSYAQINNNNNNNNNNNSNNNDNDNSNSNGNINITSILSKYPELSDFNHLLSSTDIPSEVLHRSSLTILAVPNSLLRLRLSLLPPSSSLPDILRFHILLQFLSYPDLLRLPPSGSLFSTLLQTSGDHPSATLNLTHHLIFTTSTSSNTTTTTTTTTNNNDSMSSSMSSSATASASATILSSILSLPYNLSIFSISSLLIPPTTTSLSASQTRPPLSLNITRVLLDAHNFNVAASMLTASGVSDEFLADERGAGITIFVPTDLAFSQLPLSSLRLQSLPADRKAVVLKYHVLHSYYPLGSLESIVNPVQPTLATESTGAGTFTLNITRLNGSVAIDTGIVLASITQTVFDQNPVAIFAVSKVLLPKDVFADHLLLEAPPPQFVAPSPDFHLPPTRLVAPPSLSGEIHSTHRSSGHASSSSSPLLLLLLLLLFQYIMLRLFFSV